MKNHVCKNAFSTHIIPGEKKKTLLSDDGGQRININRKKLLQTLPHLCIFGGLVRMIKPDGEILISIIACLAVSLELHLFFSLPNIIFRVACHFANRFLKFRF